MSTKLVITTSHPIYAHLILQQLPITVNDAADTAFRHKKLKYDMPIPRTLEKASTAAVHWFDWTKSYLWVVRGIRARSLVPASVPTLVSYGTTSVKVPTLVMQKQYITISHSLLTNPLTYSAVANENSGMHARLFVYRTRPLQNIAKQSKGKQDN